MQKKKISFRWARKYFTLHKIALRQVLSVTLFYLLESEALDIQCSI